MIGRRVELCRYQTSEGKLPFSDFLDKLDVHTRARVPAYVDRMKGANFGRSEPVGEGVSELKINFGPGYRVYYMRYGQTMVILFCGGDKRSQQADIRNAREYAADYRRRK